MNLQSEPDHNYIFWVYGWGEKPHPIYSDLFKCEINENLVKIYSDPVLEIAINTIQNCSQVNFGSSYNMRGFVKISLDNQKSIYIAPANSINPNDAIYSVNGEVHDMITVIKDFARNATPTLDKNPYIRNFKRGKQSRSTAPEAWNPNVSPWEYFPKLNNKFMIPRFILSMGVGLLFIILLLLLILALLGQIHISFQ